MSKQTIRITKLRLLLAGMHFQSVRIPVYLKMAFYQYRTSQFIPASLDEVWSFISNPANLQKITPPSMGLIPDPQTPQKMYEGMIIRYRVQPLPGYKTTWVSEITRVVERQMFIDEQRIGPYALWHHEHHLTEQDNGVLMEDIISYSPPFGILGALANKLFIAAKLNSIFDYRRKRLETIYGNSNDTT